MAKQTVTVGNAIIALAGNDDPFKDEHHRPLFPLTSRVIHDHLMMIINESSCPDLWNARRVTG